MRLPGPSDESLDGACICTCTRLAWLGLAGLGSFVFSAGRLNRLDPSWLPAKMTSSVRDIPFPVPSTLVLRFDSTMSPNLTLEPCQRSLKSEGFNIQEKMTLQPRQKNKIKFQITRAKEKPTKQVKKSQKNVFLIMIFIYVCHGSIVRRYIRTSKSVVHKRKKIIPHLFTTQKKKEI